MLAIFAGALFAAVLIVSHYTERRAEACFADFLGLKIGQSDFTDLLKLHKKYGGALINTPSCSPQHCEYQFSFQNNWLHSLRLAPRMALVLGVGVENNRITGRSMWYGMDPGDTPATHVTEIYTIVTDTIPEEGPPLWQVRNLAGPDRDL